MEKCAWCGKKVEGEVRETPAYHTNCTDHLREYIGAVEKLRNTCSKVMECANSIQRTPMKPHDALRKLGSELEEAERLSTECSTLFVTRTGGA